MLLETSGLVKKYSGRIVVNEVSITIERQSIVGLLGRNGAGKTTTFRMVIGMITPTSGSVQFEGQDITKLPMYRRARLGMGYLSQEPSIFQRLTVRQNIMAILETMKLAKADRQESFILWWRFQQKDDVREGWHRADLSLAESKQRPADPQQ